MNITENGSVPYGRTTRRRPRWSEIRPLLQLGGLGGDRRERRLQRCLTIDDLRRLARRRTPTAVFDYVDGGADDEIALRRAQLAYQRVEFHPHVLRDVSHVDTSTTILGLPAALPLAFGPTGFTRMMHHAGERAVVRAAARAGIPYTLSTMGTTSAADVVESAPGADVWFQLYLWRDRGRSTELVQQVRQAGVRTLMLTVDVPVGGNRRRDARSGLTIPPTLTWQTLLQIARYPSWWGNVITTEPLTFASFSDAPDTLAEMFATMFDPAMTLDDLGWLRSLWDGPIVIKGVQRVDDAVALLKAGADALVLSHHGGRQLDRAVAPLELLPQVVQAVGDRAEIYVDSGVRSGADVAAAVALGARACLVGRAYLYGLMAGGERGVDRAAELLAGQFRQTMQLLGARTVADLTEDLVSLRP
jgi:L-lactate dehydrogenase (cytochrome)